MGTFASVSVPASAADTLSPCVAEATGSFADFNALFSTYIESSEISRLNRDAGGASVVISATTAEMLRLARHYGELSDGAFDISVKPLMQLWGFRGTNPPTALPVAADREALLPLVDYRRVELSDGTARLLAAGMQVDLGGIAKGFAVDACFDGLVKTGHRDILVNLGGNMRGSGSAAPNRAWRVGVRHPFDRSQLVGAVALPDGWAVATSGNYEKFIEIDDQRYAHIMDPRTGLPVQGMAGATVLSRTGVEADALSTALFVVGMQGAGEMLARAPDSEALLIPDRHPLEIHVTPGFADHFAPLPSYEDAVRVMRGGGGVERCGGPTVGK
ncbi:MAG: FAD:protein FMN transferase [Kiritimatiellia bacterium]|jgi:thiamine biosynthesis lipoprotein|nr:FAD:protein FMN transferase [Kiritimatiellia bacterium]MDP6629952.1 FAD:protein FMN transferase [Kiritimatiellia bacterium]MDP6810150.1 FAD:protein FMN transferase [Kiritimatiellia bacterium]MDP7023632.1 FAD:protein FMN transferase [Kiritimatiellia bacterium]